MSKLNKDYFIDKIKQQYKEVGSNLYNINGNFIADNINNKSKYIEQISITSLEKGKFYFMYYDLTGKTSKMEKINPLFIVDWFDINNTRTIYAVSTNFIPINIRTLFFNNIFNYNLDILGNNLNKSTIDEDALEGINFYNIYKLLSSIGFEWALRKFDYKLVNKIYAISTDILPEFISMSTARITGVDDGKLIEIWKKKILEQEKYRQKIINELLGDYNKLNKTLNNEYITLDKKADNLQKSLQIISKNFK